MEGKQKQCIAVQVSSHALGRVPTLGGYNTELRLGARLVGTIFVWCFFIFFLLFTFSHALVEGIR